MMTWADFKLKFSKYHVPQGLIKKMRDEFRELKQGRMSVVEYRDRFLTLSRYAPDETDTNEKRKERFLNGLHDEMQTVLVNIPFADLEALVDSAIQMEGKLHQANENRKRRMMDQNGPHHTRRPPKPGGNNNNNSHHNNNNPNSNNNNGNNNNTNTGPRTGSNAIPVTPKDKSTVNCYECGVVGHYSNECPKKLAKMAPNTAAPAQQLCRNWKEAQNTEGETERRPRAPTPQGRGRPPAAPAYEEGAPVPLRRRLFAYLTLFDLKTPYHLTKPERLRAPPPSRNFNSGDRSLCPGTGRGSAPEAISINAIASIMLRE
ncbi:hypothetical protein QYE76_035246 [Lolium multiflorum]|uniref:CCHC-type domain-containing protein n=1 Tax=Lolium multiflorum TaxID=4521 RepID=A0AAD8QYV6_LOLMU|nr:hypothetical protein QYE76_035246 [Lolium multiflorum]